MRMKEEEGGCMRVKEGEGGGVRVERGMCEGGGGRMCESGGGREGCKGGGGREKGVSMEGELCVRVTLIWSSQCVDSRFENHLWSSTSG